MSRKLFLSFASFVLGMGAVLSSGAAYAVTPLTSAEVREIVRRVQLLPKGQTARDATLSDMLRPEDALQTARGSRAGLRFNDGSWARVGEMAVFRFVPGSRNFRLTNGTVLLLIKPGQGRTTIDTPNASAGVRGSALFVRYDEQTETTIVGALTNNPAGPMEILDNTTGRKVPLEAGQMAIVDPLGVRLFNFDMHRFYETSDIVRGLDLERRAATPHSEPGIAAVQAETSQALKEQKPLTGPVVENPKMVQLSPTTTEFPANSPRSNQPATQIPGSTGTTPQNPGTPPQTAQPPATQNRTDPATVNRDGGTGGKEPTPAIGNGSGAGTPATTTPSNPPSSTPPSNSTPVNSTTPTGGSTSSTPAPANTAPTPSNLKPTATTPAGGGAGVTIPGGGLGERPDSNSGIAPSDPPNSATPGSSSSPVPTPPSIPATPSTSGSPAASPTGATPGTQQPPSVSTPPVNQDAPQSNTPTQPQITTPAQPAPQINSTPVQPTQVTPPQVNSTPVVTPVVTPVQTPPQVNSAPVEVAPVQVAPQVNSIPVQVTPIQTPVTPPQVNSTPVQSTPTAPQVNSTPVQTDQPAQINSTPVTK